MTALLLAILLSAPTEVEIHFMPPGTPLELKLEGVKTRVQYFTFDEYKLLLKMDQDLWDAMERLRIYKDIDKKYEKIIEQKDTIIGTLQSDIEVKNARIARVEELWHKAEKEAIDNAGGPIWPYVVGAAGAVVGIVGATLYLSERLR